jgi:hypothetical protein
MCLSKQLQHTGCPLDWQRWLCVQQCYTRCGGWHLSYWSALVPFASGSLLALWAGAVTPQAK